MLNTLLYYRFALNSALGTFADLSSLTRVQAETLKMHIALRKHEIKMQQALESRKNGGISRGTYYRILAQAKRNVKKSLFTVATAAQLGLLKPEDVQKLISSVSMIPESIESEKLPEILALVNAMAERIVML
jgi:Glu-tRNA(Gln) amidotransferase subunit E-like FAD-binding protein